MDFYFSFLSSLLPYLISLIFLLISLEQISYLKKKRHLPGPSFIPLPFFGSTVSLIRNPTSFWNDQSRFAKSSPLGISANYIVGRFILFIRSSDLSHKIFSNVREDAFHLVGHPFGKKLFGEHNLIYMFGDRHKDLRRRIAPNFTPKALNTYTDLQQRVVVKHLMAWRDLSAAGPTSKPIKLRLLVRDMNLETSQTVFVGPYLAQEARQKFKEDYNLFNVGLMKLPFDFPGFAFRAARLAVSRLVHTLAACAEDSKSRMSAREAEPTYLIDFWMQDTIREEEETAAKEDSDSSPQIPPSSFPSPTSEEIGGHLFDFLFAAQDASSSSLLWAVTLLDSHPEVLSRVREEVAAMWTPELDVPITGEQLASLRFTEAVAREVIRIRAPATMVPHIAGVDFPLTETYTIPKGTIVFPSVYESSFQGFPEPEKFDPDRFYDEDRAEDRVYKRNYLAFGSGPHQCVGQRYAIRHLVLFIAMFASLFDFKRVRTDDCDDITYVPTICPKDDCTVVLSARCKRFPSFVK